LIDSAIETIDDAFTPDPPESAFPADTVAPLEETPVADVVDVPTEPAVEQADLTPPLNEAVPAPEPATPAEAPAPAAVLGEVPPVVAPPVAPAVALPVVEVPPVAS
jgi:hypothetical protein